MPKIAYTEINFTAPTLAVIEQANDIIDEYDERGYSLTLRQLYYQMVARDLIPNSLRSYKRLGRIVADGREAGLIDWLAIEDRTRNLRANQHWSRPQDIVRAAMNGYRIDKWQNQPYQPEVWVEKDALVDVVGRTCRRLDVPFFSCRGYTSASEMWYAGWSRLGRNGREPIIFHLGDHDPSGLDMTRDIRDRLETYYGEPITVRRIALNMDQVEQYGPPPNPANDSRFEGYLAEYGRESWELDALDPDVIDEVITEAVLAIRDDELWAIRAAEERRHKQALEAALETIDIDV